MFGSCFYVSKHFIKVSAYVSYLKKQFLLHVSVPPEAFSAGRSNGWEKAIWSCVGLHMPSGNMRWCEGCGDSGQPPLGKMSA